MTKLNQEQQRIKDWLIKENHAEPTKKTFATYMQSHSDKYKANRIFFEDIHYAWRNKLYILS